MTLLNLTHFFGTMTAIALAIYLVILVFLGIFRKQFTLPLHYLFKTSDQQANMLFAFFFALYETLILVFMIIPYIALSIIN